MKSLAITGKFSEANVDGLAVVVFKGEKAGSPDLQELNTITGGVLDSLIGTDEFQGEAGETALLRFAASGRVKARRLLIIGAGERSDYKPHNVAVVAGTAVRAFQKLKLKSVALDPRAEGDAVAIAQAAMQGALCSRFELDKYKSAERTLPTVGLFALYVANARSSEVKAGLHRGEIIGDSMNFTRDLANEPPNILTPTEMATRAQKMAKEVGLKVEVLDEARMTKMGMNSLMSVSKGSEEPAKLIVLRYTPAKAPKKDSGLLALVGKGITFDTGGISLKPGDGMEAMKYDMSGGATVLGAMRAIALLKPSVPVLGVVAAVENMPDGKASRPSDVVTAMNGKTIEILNTDAEGRLILADAVAYAEKQGANRIIDMATLTGAVVVALGDQNTGVLGNDQELIDEIIQCGKENGEGFWQLPVSKEYSNQIKSDIADIKNIGPRGKAGTIMGAVFIQEFVDKAKWAHLDIAGTAWADAARPHASKGPTGVAIRSLLTLVERSQ